MTHAASDLISIGKHSGASDVIANVVFVHGLGGDNRTTWQCDEKQAATFWPEWLYEDLTVSDAGTSPPVGVWSLGYPADVFRVLFFSKALDDSVPQRARNLIDTLVSRGLADRPIVFVAHSLGGVLVKQMLRSSCDAGSPRRGALPRLALSTRLVLFLATPHTGSSIARLAESVPAVASMAISGLVSAVDWLPLGWAARALARRAVQRAPFTKALERGDPYLEDLTAWYRHNAQEIGVETRAYYENSKVKGLTMVVDKESANPGVSGVEAIPIDADHGSICKPSSRNEHYQRLFAPIRDAIHACPIFKETHLAVFDVGERFERLAQLLPADRMTAVKRVVQPIEVRLGRTKAVDYKSSVGGSGVFAVQEWQDEAAATSPYDLDRIILNVWRQYRGGIPPSDPTVSVRLEHERLKARGLNNKNELTLIPLYYAARALRAQIDKGAVQLSASAAADTKAATGLVEEIAERFQMDEHRDTRNMLESLLPSAT